MPEPMDPHTAEQMAAALRDTGRYRVVERLEKRASYTDRRCTEPRTGLFIDVETTGLDPALDRIIQVALLPFTFDREGNVYEVQECVTMLEDPGIPIPPEVTKLTGITQEDVAGKHIDDARVDELATASQLVIAHHARFDRAFVDRRFDAFREHHWACSMEDVPWAEHGITSAKLEWLAFAHCGVFYDSHRADADCHMGLHLLATPLPNGEIALASLLRSARVKMVRVWAESSPFDSKDLLKRRGYRWNPEGRGHAKTWYRELPEEKVEAEMQWLAAEVYPPGTPNRAKLQPLDRKLRYSERA
ncbi:MAG: hypothetical protein JWO05_3902 [Gemmatimonadetes bacterium]|nr:hypothetical protein [Gemmatimonadota bacterium]